MCMLEESVGSSELFLGPGALPLSLLSPRKEESSLCSPEHTTTGSRMSTPVLREITKVRERGSAAEQAGHGCSMGQWMNIQLKCGPWQCKRKALSMKTFSGLYSDLLWGKPESC